MASPIPKSRLNSRSKPQSSPGTASRRSPPATNDPPEVVDPIWMLKAIGLTIVAAFVCGYLTLCLLFYQGQWQLVLHPSRAASAPTAIGTAPFETVRFGLDETAFPQLTGWFIPALPGSRYAAYTLLYLPSGDGSLIDAVPTLTALRETGISIFAFDYRGYGQSATMRPNEKRMAEDAASAWQYLTVSRGLPPSRTVVFGKGVGAALAAQIAAAHPEIPGVILEAPRPDLIQAVRSDPRTKSLPVQALFREDFNIAASVSSLKTPKLFLLQPGPPDPGATPAAIERLTSSAATPKTVTTLGANDATGPVYQEAVTRFLDQYLR